MVTNDNIKSDKQNSQIVVIIHIKIVSISDSQVFFHLLKTAAEKISFMNVEIFLIYLFKGNLFSTHLKNYRVSKMRYYT